MKNLINYIEKRKNHLITLVFLLLISLILIKNLTPSSAQFIKTWVINVPGEIISSK